MDSTAITTLFQELEGALTPSQHDIREGEILVTRSGYQVHDLETLLEKHKPNPNRARGTTLHDTLESLIAHANRNKLSTTTAYCTLAAASPCLTVIYNDHVVAEGDVDPGWRDHRAVYRFPASEAWARWTRVADRSLSVAEFAELLEIGIGNIRDPSNAGEVPQLPGVKYATPAELLTLANGLSVRVEQRVVEQRRSDNGTATLMFSEEHTNDKGEPLRVPSGFLLGIPVFLGGDPYAIPVRLRYRIVNKAVTWSLALHDAEAARRNAITEAAKRFEEAAQLPLYFGTPDA